MKRHVHRMRVEPLENSRVEQLMIVLSQKLNTVTGKKQYGYLSPPLKFLVNEIVDELAKDERVKEAYGLWYELREEVLRTYRDDLPERLPLSRQKEFKRIRNMVIEEAVRLDGLEPHADQFQSPPMLTAGTRLLRHVANIFQEQTLPSHGRIRFADRKLLQKLREKKMLHGHKADDREEQIQPKSQLQSR